MFVNLRRRPFRKQAFRFAISRISYDNVCRILMGNNIDNSNIVLGRTGSFHNGIISKRKIVRHRINDLLLALGRIIAKSLIFIRCPAGTRLIILFNRCKARYNILKLIPSNSGSSFCDNTTLFTCCLRESRRIKACLGRQIKSGRFFINTNKVCPCDLYGNRYYRTSPRPGKCIARAINFIRAEFTFPFRIALFPSVYLRRRFSCSFCFL